MILKILNTQSETRKQLTLYVKVLTRLEPAIPVKRRLMKYSYFSNGY